MNATDALRQLKEGNQRFVTTMSESSDIHIPVSTLASTKAKLPFAIILGCSDSRVPAELVFHQGLGDLFVIRVAGNIIAPSQIGSIEFACQRFGTQLVVVMGHTDCGAISATVESLLGDTDAGSPNIAAIVDRVVPAVHQTVMDNEDLERSKLLTLAGRANVAQSVASLKVRSGVLAGLLKDDKLQIVGAEYSIETGVVEFFD